MMTEMENQLSKPTIVELSVAEEVDSIWRQNLAFGTGTIVTYFPDI
jgi:hypothetical protein